MRRFASLLAVAATLSVAGASRADIPPTNSGGCQNKSANAACMTDDGKRGTCAASKCPRRSMLPDGGWGIVDADCLLCSSSADTTSGGSSTGGSTGGMPTGSSSGGSASSGGSSKSGCSASSRSSGSGAVALAAILAFAWTRRRRA